jgi:hypothetical protein
MAGLATALRAVEVLPQLVSVALAEPEGAQPVEAFLRLHGAA